MSPPGLSSLEAWALSDPRLFWICLHLASLSLAEVNALKQRVTILDGHLRRFQNAFSQYKKGEFLDLTSSTEEAPEEVSRKLKLEG